MDLGPDKTIKTYSSAQISELLVVVEDRLANVETEAELLLLIKTRKEVLEQDNFVINENHRRWLERRKLLFEFWLSISAIPVGFALLFSGWSFYPGSTYPGLFILGLAFYSLAPEFVKSITQKSK